MATNWYYRLQDGAESEPVRFRELADLIRRGEIGPTTDIHPEYDPEWRSADGVVGLIYTSRRIQDVAGTDQRDENTTTFGKSETDVEGPIFVGAVTPESHEGVAGSGKIFSWFWCLFAWLPGKARPVIPPLVEETTSGMVESNSTTADSPGLTDAPSLNVNANVGSQEHQCGAVPETELSVPIQDSFSDVAVTESGTTFDNLELFDNEVVQASANIPPETNCPSQPAESNEAPGGGDATHEDGQSVKLGSAISDAVRNWDENHALAAQSVPEISSRDGGTGLLAVLRLPKQWLERFLLRALRLPIEIVGWTILRGDKLVTQIADRVGHESFLLGFRLLAAIIAVNVSIFAIEAMASNEAMRFPGWQQDRDVKSFPLVGECSPFEYWFLTVDVAIVAGVVTYRLARNVEFSSDP